MSETALHADPESERRRFADAIAWLWRLGPVAERPAPELIGVGGIAEAVGLAAAVKEKRLRGAIVFADGAGEGVGPIPARRVVAGAGRFERGARVAGEFTVFDRGRPLVETRLGVHAVRDGRLLIIGFDPVEGWGKVAIYWVLEAVQRFIVELLERPVLQLPPVGSLRTDDVPGTAQQQLEQRARSDREARRRLNRLLASYRAAGARLSVAVAAGGLRDGHPVPTDEVWPEGVAVLRHGIEEGVFEPVCHGLLHYAGEGEWDPDAWPHVEPREFARLDQAEAGRRLDAALEWQRRLLGQSPRTFVAPAWGYSAGTLAACAERRLPAWHRAAPEPLIVDDNPRETLIGPGGTGGVHKLDYGSLAHLAGVGLPPTVALHGRLLDDRITEHKLRDAGAYARLFFRRDSSRLPRVRGLRWIGAGELVDIYRAHDASEMRGNDPVLPDGTEAVLVSSADRRLVRG